MIIYDMTTYKITNSHRVHEMYEHDHSFQNTKNNTTVILTSYFGFRFETITSARFWGLRLRGSEKQAYFRYLRHCLGAERVRHHSTGNEYSHD